MSDIIGFAPEAFVKRKVHIANVEEVAIRVRVEHLPGGRYLGTSPDVPGLVAEGRSLSETIEIAQGLARKIVESCREHGDPLPAVFRNGNAPTREFRVPVMMP
jgi:antitoxin HicB